MSINLALFRRKFVIVLLFCVFGSSFSAMAQTLGVAPGGFTSEGRRLADLNIADLSSEISLRHAPDNRVIKNLLWSVQRNGTAADLERFDSLYSSFKAASAQGLGRVHSSIRADYTAEVLEELWLETREALRSRGPLACAKVF